LTTLVAWAAGWGPQWQAGVARGYEARSLCSFTQACTNSHGAVRDKTYHVVTTFTNINGNTVPPVNRSTIGYFKFVVGVSFRSPVIAVLPKMKNFRILGVQDFALNQKELTSSPAE
jgi:hypothetical protein